MRDLLIAASMADAKAWGKNDHVVVVITPRSLNRTRGVSADRIVWTSKAFQLPGRVKARILAAIAPCFATTPPPGVLS